MEDIFMAIGREEPLSTANFQGEPLLPVTIFPLPLYHHLTTGQLEKKKSPEQNPPLKREAYPKVDWHFV